MGKVAKLCAVAFLLIAYTPLSRGNASDKWIRLFDGKTLNGWKASDNPGSFKVEDGAIVANGPRSHLYYDGPVMNHNFKNFELKADVMTTQGSNSGIYFHTEFQEKGWPNRGYEAQVNNTQEDPRKTGSLYAIKDVLEAPAKDNEWFTEEITVKGKQIIIKVNGKMLVDYTEPEGVQRPANMAGRLLSSGTFALQGHDPKSKVSFKNIM